MCDSVQMTARSTIGPDKRKPDKKLRRTNQDWISDLSGTNGYRSQTRALRELFRFLFVVVHNHLMQKQPSMFWLAEFDAQEVEALTEDVVQICLEKMSRDDFLLLEQFNGYGYFTSWAAQIALNELRSELRRVRWRRLRPLDQLALKTPAAASEPERIVQRKQIYAALHRCLDQLPPHYRTVLVRCVMQGEPAARVAVALNRNVQAIYNLTLRAKKQLADLLLSENISPTDLDDFEA